MDEDSEEFEDTLDHVLFPQQSRSKHIYLPLPFPEVSSNSKHRHKSVIFQKFSSHKQGTNG